MTRHVLLRGTDANMARQVRAIHDASLLSGFCYTQLTDTYQEANGLLRADRTPKLPVEWIAACTRGRFDLLPP